MSEVARRHAHGELPLAGSLRPTAAAVRRYRPSARDKFFKSYFERPEVLGQLLEFVLPLDIMERLDTSSLRLEPRTYVDKDHREYFADLSASVEWRGGPARVYVLFEHKSWSDAGTLLQLLRSADELSLVGSLRPIAAVR